MSGPAATKDSRPASDAAGPELRAVERDADITLRHMVLGPGAGRRWAYALLGLIGSAALGGVYASLISRGADWNSGLPWERTFLLRMHVQLPRMIDAVVYFMPWLGTNLTLLPIILGVGVWLVVKRRRADLALHVLVVEIGTLLLNALMKDAFGRQRPHLWPMRGQYQWSSFPSGHAIASTAVLFTVAALLHRERGWTWPYFVAALMLCISLYSRLYLGVHWPTDVIGGLLVGFAWLFSSWKAFRSS
jgi:undecaprenyl-diphosphatase